jgi:hypothetical protein
MFGIKTEDENGVTLGKGGLLLLIGVLGVVVILESS